MYAKILIILVLAILCTGCTDPDLPDPYEFENVTPGAPALKKSWNPETQTITISTLDDTPRLTIRKVSSNPDLCTFEEVLEIKSFVDYDLNKLKDFRARWMKHRGQHDITKVEWFILKNESYDITVDDYETIQVEETHYDNVTEEYYNVTVNQTVLIGNHSEVWYHTVWKPFSPVGKSIHAGQTYVVKIVYHKPAELGNVRIQTIPMFAGVECGELTWWNTSWLKRVEKTINNASVALTDYQLMNTTAYDSDMNSNFSDLRFTNESGTLIPYWIESKTDSVSADVWLKIPSISTTTGAKVWMYYGNADASSASSIQNTFISGFDGDSTGWTEIDPNSHITFVNNRLEFTGLTRNEDAYVYQSIGTDDNIIIEWDHQATSGHASGIAAYGILSDMLDDFVNINNGFGVFAYSPNVNIRQTIRVSDTGYYGTTVTIDNSIHYCRETRIGNTVTTNVYTDADRTNLDASTTKTQAGLPTLNYVMMVASWNSAAAYDITGWLDNFRVRKYTATEPTWAADGEEESVSIITAYTPSTPLQKTAGDSQLFTVNTSENSQCRWYINGSLKQTNSTGATRHEYTNSSLNEGYWNFTATANTTNRTSSQTWWVTVTAAGTFGQDMYSGRWMYVTYLDGSNTNLSEFFTDLAPYYLSFYNATDQKTYNYKSGRWEKYASKEIKPGEAAMLRYTSNVAKTRNNAAGTFGFTMKTGLNHIGHSYNGSRNLTWYNTTIASANLVTIEHQNPVDGTVSTFTYGSAANGTVEVLQGFGVEVNVSSDTVISGL